jgi:hypothetical protein
MKQVIQTVIFDSEHRSINHIIDYSILVSICHPEFVVFDPLYPFIYASYFPLVSPVADEAL